MLAACSSSSSGGDSDLEQHQIIGQVTVSNQTAESLTVVANSSQLQSNLQSQNIKVKGLKSSNQIQKKKIKKYKAQEIIVKYKSKGSPLQSLSTTKGNQEKKTIKYKLPSGKSVEEAIKEYQSDPNIEYVQPNYIYHATKVPNDTYYQRDLQWAPINLNLEAAWDQETGSEGIRIAVIDSGIIKDHSDLSANVSIEQGHDFVDNDSYPYDESLDENTRGHGTHVAGIIGALGNNKRGITGTNWNVTIIPIRVLEDNPGDNNDTGDTLTVTDGINYAIEQDVDIINLSLGGSGNDPSVKSIINTATSKGILVFASSGNYASDNDPNNDSVLYPAAYSNTVAVGAVGRNNKRSSYSNYGENLDLVAPGNYIYSTWGYYDQDSNKFIKDYASLSGTSMAAPYASGVAGLLLAQGVPASQVISRMKNTAVDLGPSDRDDEYGCGLVDAYGALLGKKLSAPKIFAAVKDENSLVVKSEITQADNGASYQLDQINEGKVHIIGWRDVNGDDQVNKGDYYGNSGLITVNDSSQTVNLQLNYIGDKDYSINVKGLSN